MKGPCAEEAMLVARQTAGRISRIRFSIRVSLAMIGSTPMALLRYTKCQSGFLRHFDVSPFNFLGFRDCAMEDQRPQKPLSRATVCPESRTPPQNRTPIVRGVPASGIGAAKPRKARQGIHQEAGVTLANATIVHPFSVDANSPRRSSNSGRVTRR